MRAAPLSTPLTAWLLAWLLGSPGLALAQTPSLAPAGRAEPLIEKIHHEDKGSRIDELRVGGETKNITVRPKGDLPAYEVNPDSSNRNPATADRQGRTSGPSGWKVLGF